MKKLILLTLILLMTACKPQQVEELTFNEKTYTFSEVSSDGYDMFVGDGHLLEVKYEDEEFIITTEIDEDIYIIIGDMESYDISKNGTTILIDGKDLEPTGSEMVPWNEDILGIMEQYK